MTERSIELTPQLLGYLRDHSETPTDVQASLIETTAGLGPVAGMQVGPEQGELLAPGSGIVVVTDLANAWLNAYIPEPDLGRIRLGQLAEVVTDDGQAREGRISFIASTAEFTPKNVQTQDERVKLVYRVKIRLFNDDHLFKPGMPAEARFGLPEANGAEG